MVEWEKNFFQSNYVENYATTNNFFIILERKLLILNRVPRRSNIFWILDLNLWVLWEIYHKTQLSQIKHVVNIQQSD